MMPKNVLFLGIQVRILVHPDHKVVNPLALDHFRDAFGDEDRDGRRDGVSHVPRQFENDYNQAD